MMLNDLPELQQKVDTFLESGTELESTLRLYRSHGVTPIPERVERAVRNAMQALRRAVEEGEAGR